MKYIAIISADEPLTEDIIQDLKNTMFFGDDPAYAFEIEDIKLEQEPTTKNNLGVDCISRTRAIERLKLNFPISQGADNSRDRHRYMQALADLQAIKELPPVTPQEPTDKIFTKADLDSMAKAINYGCELRVNEVLDKIRAEIKKWYWQADKQALAKDPCVVDAMIDLFIRTIDKYKAESEPQESEEKA